MQQIEADPLPVISQKWVRKKKMKNPTTLALSPSAARNGLTARYNIYYTTENNAYLSNH